MKNKLTIILSVLLLLITSCSKKTDNKGINLTLKIVPNMLTDDLYTRMHYTFDFNEDFKKLDNKYKVFVHFYRVKSKEMLIQDDHFTEIDTKNWEKGKKIEYSRELYIPKFLDEYDIDFEGYEKVRISAGIYDPGNLEEKITLFKKEFNVQSASINAPEIIYDEGWHQQETNFKSDEISSSEWRWTTGKAVCIVENPKKDAVLRIKGHISKETLKDQKIKIMINKNLLDEFSSETGNFEKKYLVPSGKMGKDEEFKLSIEVSHTFIPSKLDPNVKDGRVLGIQIYTIYFRENYVD